MVQPQVDVSHLRRSDRFSSLDPALTGWAEMYRAFGPDNGGSMTIYAATSNKGKLAEFAASASGDGVEVLALPGLADMPEPVEDADSFMGNAELKARAYSLLARELTGQTRLVMADDSGLCVDALGGLPGVRSARFAEDRGFEGGGSVDSRNNVCLVQMLRGRGAEGAAAQFRCALALAQDGVVLLRATGAVDGLMLLEERGEGGFGYDPLFLVPEFGRTLAELTREEKWAVSHRGRAFRELLSKLNFVSKPNEGQGPVTFQPSPKGLG